MHAHKRIKYDAQIIKCSHEAPFHAFQTKTQNICEKLTGQARFGYSLVRNANKVWA